jgi:hypothetical protein
MRNPRGGKIQVFFVACCLCVITFSSAHAVDVPNKKEIVTKARQSYYNLHDLGLAGFRCDVDPNWDLAIADLKKKDPQRAASALKDLSMLQIAMSLDAQNNVTVTKNELPGTDPQWADARKQTYDGISQMITGFYQTTSEFILGNPFPEVNAEYQLEDDAGQYRLAYKDSGVSGVIYMDKDLMMSKLEINSAEFTSNITPRFTRNSKGFLLQGYGGTYKGVMSPNEMKLNVQITYQDVSGLQLPQKLNVSEVIGGASIVQELGFSGCQVTRK